MARYLVGIDLGTTNSAVSYVDLQEKPTHGGPRLHPFAVAQLVNAGDVQPRPLLPSFLYLPGPHDLPPGATALPWDATNTDVVGVFARTHGAKVPGRQVTSAKSWLCHPGVDRAAPLLPWGGPPDVPKLSPLEVSSRYLRHIVLAWNAAHPADRLEYCPVVITVPASFDDTARTLTAEAAKKAGLMNVSLLEEPQAAFYAWLGTHLPQEATRVKPGMRCVVVDVGGGTSDFSLIRAAEGGGDIAFDRDAVGEHLLLGGDNMDLALARAAEAKLSTKLDAGQFGQLIQACREAKELLLGPQPPESVPVTVVGRGRSVVGGTISTTLTPADVTAALHDGFFPAVPYDAEPVRTRIGVQEMGLPYVADAAITKHLAAFLRQHLASGEIPELLLFNGGVFQPQALRDRLIEVVKGWFGPAWDPVILTSPSLDLAVAWGAAYFAWLKHSGGTRIGGGIPRSYYVGLGDDRVVCVVPRQLQEGDEVQIASPTFELALGEPVLFPLFTSTVRGGDQAGELLSLKPEQLRPLPPLHTILRGGKRAGAKRVPVTLAAKCTEIGTLELACVSNEGNRWTLEFNVRELMQTPDDDTPNDGPRIVDVFPEERVHAARMAIDEAFAADGDAIRDLAKTLETKLELGRTDWPTSLCRRVVDAAMAVAESRGRSPQHLGRWYHLIGYGLRPGFGDPLDKYRIDTLWKTIAAGAATTATKPIPEGGADYWIMWRRLAGGLNLGLQQQLFSRLRPVLLPVKGKAFSRPHPNEYAEMWRAAAALERLDVKVKQSLAEPLLKAVAKPPVPTYAYWSLTRLGARVPLTGPLNAIVNPGVVEPWIETLIANRPTAESDRIAWAFCLVQLARPSGVRAVDVSETIRDRVTAALESLTIPDAWRTMLAEVTVATGDEQSRLFGESLPIGLRLMA
jgi:molecular chaperone DnaK (HSP70)